MVVEGERPSMPHVPRPVIVTVEAPPSVVEEVARETLGLHRDDDGALTGSLPDWTDPNARVRVEIEPEDTGRARVSFVIEGAPHVPYFQWFFGPLLRRSEQRTLQHRADLLAAEIEGRPAPPPPKRSPLLPPVPFPARATALLATVAAIAALANFGGALFGQTADSVTKTFGASQSRPQPSVTESSGWLPIRAPPVWCPPGDPGRSFARQVQQETVRHLDHGAHIAGLTQLHTRHAL